LTRLLGSLIVWPAKRDAAFRDQGLQPRTRKLAQVGGEEMVEPPALVDVFGAQRARFLRVRT
jgi:hypothetical protein